MDLRGRITADQVADGLELMRKGLLGYQPFILDDDIEVGEGYNFVREYADVQHVRDLNTYAPFFDIGRRQAVDGDAFRSANAEYHSIYEHICDQLEHLVGIKGNTFAEIGCCNGLTLAILAQRGARACHGYDRQPMKPAFKWLNGVLGTDVKFTRGEYDNLRHRFSPSVGQVDVMINTVFMNHQCDPLQFLCYICDRARKGVFLWVLSDDSCSITYPERPPHEMVASTRPAPLFFNNGVVIGEKLLAATLSRLGFDDLKRIEPFYPSEQWRDFQSGFRMFFARRTSHARSAYTLGNRTKAAFVRAGGQPLQAMFGTRVWQDHLRPIAKWVFRG